MPPGLNKQKNIAAILISLLLGLIFFLILYSEVLNPKYYAWLLATDEPDLVQYYVGWEMYRYSDWSFPIGVANNYGYPVGVPVIFTDSIPILAMPLKLLSSVLPGQFQYFGIWMLICFILQAIFGYLLIENFIKKKTLAILGSVLFLLSPIMLFRIGGHLALGGQWLILSALWLLLRPHEKIQWFYWSLLLVVSLLVHPYLFFMNVFLVFADIIMLLLVYKKIKLSKAFIFFASQIILISLIAYALGYFMGDFALGGGYGQFSMNLNALVNPLVFSRIIHSLPITEYQAEGFNYLGVGIIFLLVLSFLAAVKRKILLKVIQRNWPIIVVALILTLLAISNVVTFNSKVIINVQLPEFFANNILGAVRSSGRLFWPVFYLLLLLSFYILKVTKYKIALAILLLAVFFQLFDLSNMLVERGKVFEGKKWSNHIISRDWEGLAKDYKHISFIPVIHHRNYMDFALYAAQNHLTVNNGYFARPIKGLNNVIEKETEDAKRGLYKKDTIYILSSDMEFFIDNLNLERNLLVNIDDTFILLPDYKIHHSQTEYEKLEYKLTNLLKMMGRDE
ncbi:MAG: DUF6311 domain-containing protein [Patescibacteria group bacterium]|jgi:hypothetical protein